MSRFLKGLFQVIHCTTELLSTRLRFLADDTILQLNDLLLDGLYFFFENVENVGPSRFRCR